MTGGPLGPRRWPWLLAVLVALGLAFYLLQPILLPFVLGALIGYLGDPLVDMLERRGMGRGLGVSVVFLIFTVLLAIALLIAIPALVHQVDALVRKIPDIYRWITDTLLPWLQARFSVPVSALPEIDWTSRLAENWQSLGKATASTLRGITGSGAGLLAGLFNLALVPVVAFYLMRDWDILMGKILRMVPKAWQENTSLMVGQADEVLGAFIRGQLLVMLALGVIYSLGLSIVGVQLALVLGMVAGLASIVPYLGFIVGIVSSLLVAWFQFHELSALLLVALVFGIGQVLESVVLTPILVGDRIGLHPVAVIFALMAGGQIAGFVGVLVALPVSAVIMVFLRHAVAHYRASDLYTGE
ncbi:AI-2E family transporter [Parahaliea aestuarii]|uniref:AI-2E family transporter n=1 Tax=Parahaliea aestuarii TaxID=1852021 RepID=A0A5C8ZNH9_9GAMM|nr:AI-2E family transporter [Parahaliea aestuarii]TXS89765.1 AI-2E family transporter [Parahaliea aestuarii]